MLIHWTAHSRASCPSPPPPAHIPTPALLLTSCVTLIIKKQSACNKGSHHLWASVSHLSNEDSNSSPPGVVEWVTVCAWVNQCKHLEQCKTQSRHWVCLSPAMRDQVPKLHSLGSNPAHTFFMTFLHVGLVLSEVESRIRSTLLVCEEN